MQLIDGDERETKKAQVCAETVRQGHLSKVASMPAVFPIEVGEVLAAEFAKAVD